MVPPGVMELCYQGEIELPLHKGAKEEQSGHSVDAAVWGAGEALIIILSLD